MPKTLERRIINTKFDVRSNPDGTVGVRGYAAVFDSPAHGEVIKRSAFTKTLNQKDNIRFLFNHDPNKALAASNPPKEYEPSMTVGVDERGLWFDVLSLDVEGDSDARNLVSKMNRGTVTQCSFSGYFRDAPMADGMREVREVELVDVSVVTYPWYTDTEATLTGERELDRGLLMARSLKDAPEDERPAAAARLRTELRAAPPGKSSYGDQQMALWDAVEEMIRNETGSSDAWCYLDDWGTDWAVYRVFNYDTYEFGPYMQLSWKQNTDGTFKLGTPFPVERITEYRPATSDEGRSNSDTPEQRDERPRLTVEEARALLTPAA